MHKGPSLGLSQAPITRTAPVLVVFSYLPANPVALSVRPSGDISHPKCSVGAKAMWTVTV